MQQTPNPAAQVPAEVPDWDLHSEDVRQVPLYPFVPEQLDWLKRTTENKEKTEKKLINFQFVSQNSFGSVTFSVAGLSGIEQFRMFRLKMASSRQKCEQSKQHEMQI